MPGSLAPADARSWMRCDYVFAWFAEKQALFQGWLVVDVWLSTLTQPLDDMLRNGLCLTLGCACCGLRMAVGSLWPSETKGRECLTDVIKKTRWLSAVCLHVAVLKEVWDCLALQGAETHSPKNRSNLNTVISNGKQKQVEDLDVLPYISVDCVVSVSLLLSMSFWPKWRKGVSLNISKIRPEETSFSLKEAPAAFNLGHSGLGRGAAFSQNLYRY